jgi:hypothetical protein
MNSHKSGHTFGFRSAKLDDENKAKLEDLKCSWRQFNKLGLFVNIL